MKRYIEQLIEDIHKAMQRVNPPHEIWEESEADPTNELELEDISYLEQFLGEAKRIADITGIDTNLLPPAENLTQKEKALLSRELEKLLLHFNFVPDFPKKYPYHLRYPFLLDLWDEEHVPLSFGESRIEFCDFDEENCPFPGYCDVCREVNAQMRFDDEQYRKIKEKGGIDWNPDIDELLNLPF